MKDDPLSEEDLGQDKQEVGEAVVEDATAAVESPACVCEDLLAVLSSDLMPRPTPGSVVLRKFICPGCGRVYLTNAMNDLCLDCQEKVVQLPTSGVASED
jgi:hypothetical protein